MPLDAIVSFSPLFRSVKLLTDKQISFLIKYSDAKFLKVFLEVAANFAVFGSVKLQRKERASLKEFSKQLLKLVGTNLSPQQKRSLLARNPELCRVLSDCMAKRL